MSLLLAFVTADEATIAVDSEGIRGDGSRVPMAKMFALPQIPCVFGFRGQALFAAGVIYACSCHGFASFDEVLDLLPTIAADVDAALPPFLRVSVGGESGTEFVAAGFSPSRARVVLRRFSRRDAEVQWTVTEPQAFIAPWDAETMSDIPQGPEAIEQLAQAQVRWMRANHGIGGGTLIVARVDRVGVSMTHKAQLNEQETPECQQ